MEAIPNWLLRLSGADLGYGAAATIAGAVVLVSLTLHFRQRLPRDEDSSDSDAVRQRRQLLLYCGDVKALTDLAVQRHMSDAAFLQRFREQPCYDKLVPHFSDEFRERMNRKLRQDGHADLAAACREECDRLEQQWQAG